MVSHLRDMNLFFMGFAIILPFLSNAQILCILSMNVLLNVDNLDGGNTLLLTVLRYIWYIHVSVGGYVVSC
jgi:hypothetical protein